MIFDVRDLKMRTSQFFLHFLKINTIFIIFLFYFVFAQILIKLVFLSNLIKINKYLHFLLFYTKKGKPSQKVSVFIYFFVNLYENNIKKKIIQI